MGSFPIFQGFPTITTCLWPDNVAKICDHYVRTPDTQCGTKNHALLELQCSLFGSFDTI